VMRRGSLEPRPQKEQGRAVFSGAFELTRDLELPERPTTGSGHPYDAARLLVRIGGEPIGFVMVPLGTEPLSRTAILKSIRHDLNAPVEAELRRQGLPGLSSHNGSSTTGVSHRGIGVEQEEPMSVTVVVCTRNRAHALPECLDSLRGLKHATLDFVIVDNAPTDDSTRDVVMRMATADPRFQYVREPLPGLSRARNRGLAHTRGEIIAYTDDDVRVDPLWVKGLLRGFGRRSNVGCVTGLVASASLELPAEQYFDGRVWWSSSCEAKVYDAHSGPAGNALYPYTAGAFGTGANFAVRSELLREIGEFDEILGAGSPCDGGEDLDIFVRFIRAGYALSYEPAALVWHEHRSGRDDLCRQMYSYGKALSAYLFKYASSRRTALDVLRRVPQGVRHFGVLGARSSRVGSQTGLAREPVIAEIRGLMAGPLAYARARRAQDPERRRAVAP
jgi:glycosyltransferase involved in cell wall biosynthesis